MARNRCIWCAAIADYKIMMDSRDGEQIYTTICHSQSENHYYCMTLDYYKTMLKLGKYKTHKLDPWLYQEYCSKSQEVSSKDMLVIGKDL